MKDPDEVELEEVLASWLMKADVSKDPYFVPAEETADEELENLRTEKEVVPLDSAEPAIARTTHADPKSVLSWCSALQPSSPALFPDNRRLRNIGGVPGTFKMIRTIPFVSGRAIYSPGTGKFIYIL
jgi:hypothetical protein